MENLRLAWSSMVVVATLAFACSHEERADDARATRTSGGETRAEADADAPRDPDGTSDEGARDADGDPPTALDQSNDEGDLAITQAIRVAVIDDDSLSFVAHNVTIVTVDAVVTLRGDVSTATESAAIERHARGVDGVRRVDNLLRVQP